jgi:hypothetical protein
MTDFPLDLLSELDAEDLACLGLWRSKWAVADLIRGMRDWDHSPPAAPCPIEADPGEDHLAAATTALDSTDETSAVIKQGQPCSPLSTVNGAKALPAMNQTATLTAPTDPIELERWLNGIVRLKEGAKLRGVHPDTLRREAARGRLKLIQISERAIGIRRRDALMLGDDAA